MIEESAPPRRRRRPFESYGPLCPGLRRRLRPEEREAIQLQISVDAGFMVRTTPCGIELSTRYTGRDWLEWYCPRCGAKQL